MVFDAAAVFFGTLCFAILFRVPSRELVHAAAVGLLAWLTVQAMQSVANPVAGGLSGAAVASLASEILARQRRCPVTLFLIPGIIPLVPGGKAYTTMLAFLRGDALAGLEQLLDTAFVSGGIAIGIVLVNALTRAAYRKNRASR